MWPRPSPSALFKLFPSLCKSLENGHPNDFWESLRSSGVFNSSINPSEFTECPKIGAGLPGETDLVYDCTRLLSRRLVEPPSGHTPSPPRRNLQSSCHAQLAMLATARSSAALSSFRGHV